MQGRAEKGLNAGGCPYGYRNERVEGGGSRQVILLDHASTVRNIFELYASGKGLKAVANALNGDGIESPRGRGWAPSAIREMVRNPIYRGDCVWNSGTWIKDHETGKRRRYERPESEWIVHHDEGLRIVSEDLWGRAQARHRKRGAPGETGARGGRAHARHLLSGGRHLVSVRD